MKISVTVFNPFHFPVKVDEHVFHPWEETVLEMESTSTLFRKIRSVKGLRVGKYDNEKWKEKHLVENAYEFNIVYDTYSQHRGMSYRCAIQALGGPIKEHLPTGSAGFVERPVPGINLRFFSQMRIDQLGKCPVGPYDVFYSHGIGDKDYWIAPRIRDYKNVFVPGPAWKERIEKGGYEGRVWVVGYTKLDPLFNGKYPRTERDKPYVVWAPTHGYNTKYTGRSSYPECLTLINEIPDCYEATLSLHPTTRMNSKQRQDVTMQELLDADVVIADAGSTLYEAWALGKPVIFPDWICKKDVLKKFGSDNLEHQIYAKGIGYHARNMKHLLNLIDIALSKGMQGAEIEFMEWVFPSELRGKAGQKAAEALMEIREKTRKR